MDIEMWMYIEYIEARDYVTAKKRNKQRNSEREYQQASSRGISSETSYRDLLQRTAQKQEEEKEN